MLKLTIDHLNIAFAEREVNKFYCIKMKMLLGVVNICLIVMMSYLNPVTTSTHAHTHTHANCRLLVSYYKGYIDYTYTMSHLAGIFVWFVGFLLTITSFLLITPVISPLCVCVCTSGCLKHLSPWPPPAHSPYCYSNWVSSFQKASPGLPVGVWEPQYQYSLKYLAML